LGGGEYIFFNIGKELVKRGHKVLVIAQKVKGLECYEELDGIRIYRVGPEIEHQGVLPLSLKQNIGYLVESIITGVKLLRKENVNLIHSNTYVPALAGEICSFFYRKPHIITVHDVYSVEGKDFWIRWYSQQGNINPFSSLSALMEKIIINLPADALHTVSKTSESDIRRVIRFRLNKKVAVIPNGINLKDYETESIAYKDIVLYIGRLIFYKNVDKLIKAFELISKLNSKGELIIIGDGPMKPILQGLVKKLNLVNRVHFLGRVSHEKKVKYLSCATALALPSIYEGFGIVILEAWALKKPVIVANVSPLNEIVEHGRDGLVADPYNPEEWSKYIKLLLEDKDLARKMGENGYKKLVSNYTIEKTVDKLEYLYEQIIHKA